MSDVDHSASGESRVPDPVRARTAAEVLRRIDDTTTAHLIRGAEAPPDAVASQLERLDREWDTDRALETEAAVTGLVGLALGALLRPAFLVVPAFVAASVLTHALTGRYPMMPLFRRLGLRTSREIARERYALKALRGDFADLDAGGEARPEAVARQAEPAHAGPTRFH
jgi:hypothetical protein